MEESDKLPLKRLEVSLTKFNDVAIPHHLNLLRQHKANILMHEASGALARARGEQAGAARVVAQLRTLLLELEALRRRVRSDDRARFDALTQGSRDSTLKAVVDYLGTAPLAANRASPAPGGAAAGASAASTDSVGVVAHAHATDDPEADAEATPDDEPQQIELRVDEQELELQQREALLRGWCELQAELRALHDVWQHAQAAALAQRERVASAAASVEVAADNTSAARTSLAVAERLRAGALGAGGAALGALAGGPLGLALGVKAGAAGALAGSLLGYLGARLLGRHRVAEAKAEADADAEVEADGRDRKND